MSNYLLHVNEACGGTILNECSEPPGDLAPLATAVLHPPENPKSTFEGESIKSCVLPAREKLPRGPLCETGSGEPPYPGCGEEKGGGRERDLTPVDVPEVASVVTHSDGGTENV